MNNIEKIKYRERKLTPPMNIKMSYKFEFGDSNRFICEIWDVDGIKVYEFRDKSKPDCVYPKSNMCFYIKTVRSLEKAQQEMNRLLGVEKYGTYNLGLDF